MFKIFEKKDNIYDAIKKAINNNYLVYFESMNRELLNRNYDIENLGEEELIFMAASATSDYNDAILIETLKDLNQIQLDANTIKNLICSTFDIDENELSAGFIYSILYRVIERKDCSDSKRHELTQMQKNKMDECLEELDEKIFEHQQQVMALEEAEKVRKEKENAEKIAQMQRDFAQKNPFVTSMNRNSEILNDYGNSKYRRNGVIYEPISKAQHEKKYYDKSIVCVDGEIIKGLPLNEYNKVYTGYFGKEEEYKKYRETIEKMLRGNGYDDSSIRKILTNYNYCIGYCFENSVCASEATSYIEILLSRDNYHRFLNK